MTENTQQITDNTVNPVRIDDCWNRIGVYSRTQQRCSMLATLLHCYNCQKYIDAGRLLLDRDLDEEYRRELTKIFSREKSDAPKNIISAFAFKAGREWLAIIASFIEEIVEMGMIHTIPHRSNRTFRGMVNVRGKLELCFSIGGILGIEKSDMRDTGSYHSPERLVVACRDNFRIVFPVTEVLGLIRFSPTQIQEVPVTVSHARAAFTKGVIPYDNLAIGFLDEAVLFDELKKNLS